MLRKLRMLRWLGIFILASILAFTLAGPALAQDNHEPPSLQRMIVVFEDGVPGAAQEALVGSFGGKSIKSLNLINGSVVLMPPLSAKGLENCQAVWKVEPDGIVEADEQTIPWGVDRIDAELVHPTNKGAGVKVAIIDTGVDYTHEDLDANFDPTLLGYDFVNNDSDPMDDNGHGTHVAGTIAAEDNDIGVIGVAPEANLYSLKVLNSSGNGYYSDIIDALGWCVDNGIQVASMSLGGSSDNALFHTACDNAYNAGVLIVAAAGNSGSSSILYPARYDSVIAVSASDSFDNLAYFSCYGSQNELAGPGVSITSTLLGGGYGTKSGTSMATPHVSGAAALVFASGVAGAPAVRDQLNNTAEDLGAPGWDPYFGNGLVDAEAAASSLIATGSITGTVSDDITAPIANATVTAGAHSTTTADDGTYTLAYIPVGTYNVTASAEGYVDALQPEVIIEDSQVTTVDFTLVVPPPAGSISGMVNDDIGDPIENATITANGQYITVTEADGTYTLADVPVGTYTVVASAPSYADASPVVVNVLDKQTTAGIDFSLTQLTGTIIGMVNDIDNIAPIANATIIANGEYITVTEADGTYTLADIPVGTYTVTASAEGYVENSQTVVVVSENQTAAIVDFALVPLPDGNDMDIYVRSIDFTEKQAGKNTFLYVTVTISRDSDADGIAEESDSKVEGVSFSLYINGELWTDSRYTDATGQVTFALRKAQAGTYVASVTDLTHSTYTWNSALDVENPSDPHTV